MSIFPVLMRYLANLKKLSFTWQCKYADQELNSWKMVLFISGHSSLMKLK